MPKRLLTVYLSTSIFIVACGGSEPSSPTALDPLRVNAGVDISIEENTSIPISGLASGGDGVYAYEWTAADDLALAHEDQTSPSATISAPSVSSNTSYNVSLEVSDSLGNIGTDTFSLTVNAVNIAPKASITANSIDGYEPLHYPVGTEVILDGSSSFDEDPQTDEADITSYLWQQVAGNDLTQGIDNASSILRFTAPLAREPETLEFMLTVSDQEGEQANARITIELLGQRGTLPQISVNTPITVFPGELIPLSAIVTSTAPDAAPFSLVWQNDYSESLNVEDGSQQNTYALAPLVNDTTDIAFTVSAVDAFANQVSATQIHTVLPPQKSQVPDTGLVLNANALELLENYIQDFPGQDAQYGPDSINASGLSDKAGRGEHGFDYTRLNANGDPIDVDGVQSYCVRDNITGLIWELKNATSGSIHNNAHTFTWYQEEDNGGFAGELNAQSNSCELNTMQCNTEDFVAEVNQQGLCGFFDWRVPTHQELQSIVHYGQASSPLIETEYFPFTDSAGADPQVTLWYWTNQTGADGVSDDEARNAWAIDFATGVDNLLDKTQRQHLRLVRAGRNTE